MHCHFGVRRPVAAQAHMADMAQLFPAMFAHTRQHERQRSESQNVHTNTRSISLFDFPHESIYKNRMVYFFKTALNHEMTCLKFHPGL